MVGERGTFSSAISFGKIAVFADSSGLVVQHVTADYEGAFDSEIPSNTFV
jgi:hypothetical protein